MFDVLSAVVPVVGMLLLGMILRKTGFLSRKGIDEIKLLVSRIMLSVAVFHALATAQYSVRTWMLVGFVLIVELATFAAGFAVKHTFFRGSAAQKTAKYIPFLMSLYEGGMLGYPLYANLCGTEALSNIALIDISGLIFGFSIWMGMLQQTEKGEKSTPSQLLQSALHTPTFIAAVLGVLCGVTGVIKLLMETPLGGIYLGCEQLITAPLSAMILLAVGYDMDLRPTKIREALKPVFCRAVIQALAIAAVLFAVARLYPGNTPMAIAAVIYMCVPTTFSMQTYIHDPDGCAYVSTTNSIYILITIAVYAVCAAMI